MHFGARSRYRREMRIWLTALLALAACGGRTAAEPDQAHDHELSNHAPAPTGAHVLLASLSRTACYGWCPIYTVTVYRDGVVEYDGERFVKTKGKATWHLAPDELAALDTLFTSHGYLSLAAEYTHEDVTDNPSANTAYQPAGGAAKSVTHYHGDMNAPKALDEIETGFDRIVHTETWIGTEQERQSLKDDN